MTARLRAPEENGAILIDPPPDRWPELIEKAQQFDLPSARFHNLPFQEWRELARREAWEFTDAKQPSSGPWIVAGHQPELFHPGVWLKNFVLAEFAKRQRGVGLNLIVDSDTFKHRFIRVPVWRGSSTRPDDVRALSIPFDDSSDEVPFEEAVVNNKATFDSFRHRLANLTTNWPEQPFIEQYWPSVLSVPWVPLEYRLTEARQRFERKWGIQNRELGLSSICQSESFVRFAAAILFDLPQFCAIYNRCVQQYRSKHGIRSRHHPVPELAVEGQWFESPFWVWHVSNPRRSRLFVCRHSDHLEFRADSVDGFSLSAERFIDDWFAVWLDEPIKIRSRALTTTLFARLALADVFIHGIGGAIYDELTDNISREFFGAAPPAFAVVSGTLRLPLTIDSPAEAAASPRELHWNPQRHLDAANPLVAERQRLIAEVPTTRRSRRERYRALRENLERLSPLVAGEVERARHAEADAAAWRRANAILSSRDYSFVLHSEKSLRAFFEKGMAMVIS